MLWLWIVLGALAGLVLLAAAVGWTLDRRHLVSVRFRLAQPPEPVFAVLADPSGYAAWRKDVRSVEMLGTVDGRLHYRERGRDGVILFEVVASDPPRFHEVRIADDRLPYGGCWRFVLQPQDGGTTVTITEDGFITNPVFRTLARTIYPLSAPLERYARALGERFGERVNPVAAVVHGTSRAPA